jgi:glycosyltransferase involved in cell wall biosynthesis
MLAELLRTRGHQVIWWTSTVDHFTKRFHAERSARIAIDAGLELQLLHGSMYRKNVSLARLINHRQIAAEFRQLSEVERAPDMILCSLPTLELCDEAVAYGRARGVPVLIDVRDLWPDEMLARVPTLLRPLGRIALAPLYGTARRALRGATGVIAISRSYLRWAEQLRGRAAGPDDLVAPIGYPTPALGTGVPSEIAERGIAERMRARSVDPARKLVWFSGTFVGSIDLATVIEAARSLAGDTRLQFVFSGDGERREEWMARARGLPNVVFTGWCDRAELAWLSQRAWVGLAAYKPGALMSLPNKLFEYASAGLPVVSSLAGEAAELIQHRQIGVSYRAGDAADLAAKLRGLAIRPDEVARFATNARVVFARELAAEGIYRRLGEHLEACALAGIAARRETPPRVTAGFAVTP